MTESLVHCDKIKHTRARTAERKHLGYFFFLNDPAPTEIYPLSLHDPLPISYEAASRTRELRSGPSRSSASTARSDRDRKSTSLNSSHYNISYAVFCLKKKKTSLTSSHIDSRVPVCVCDRCVCHCS